MLMFVPPSVYFIKPQLLLVLVNDLKLFGDGAGSSKYCIKFYSVGIYIKPCIGAGNKRIFCRRTGKGNRQQGNRQKCYVFRSKITKSIYASIRQRCYKKFCTLTCRL